MSQHPHDEFDDVPPYQTGEAGKHRAPGAAGTGGAGGSGLRWIGLLAGFVLLVGAFAYFIVPMLSDSDPDSTAEDQDAAVSESEDDAEDDAEADDGAEGDADQTEEPAGPQPASDTETPVQVANYQGAEGGATAMGAELEELDYNVVWQGDWGFEERAETPAVVYPAGSGDAEQAIAEELAESFGVDTVEVHDQASFVTLIIGDEYEG
ncbi:MULTISPECIES: LytR C-terminal domain-containing protein [unclassified Nesterenkonia]|uniref:LytR C-terminal domain-containing protein n=1 Tax=unclassified Nesterenkonia TaxID=2629769 RepID=UPI001F4CED98|nr:MULTISPECIES: LytR C-terminal domain-containing protein [unclassified Nesterenkonia]MCH8560696.1 LytR C-terminal domain-containing protein [Nesterenkonia sp. DZ6]MCH8570804.1 LytR C-terminal domain-containing protein [Nesterenkonia sp. AY15]